jgi:lambda family phage portal protein
VLKEERPRVTWLDRLLGFLVPQLGLKRLRARVATDLLARHYESAAQGRRTQGWRTSVGDANAVAGPALSRLRDVARDLVRNNPYAESALTTIGDHVVGWGIVAKPKKKNAKASDLWEKWAGTTDCDADGRNDFYGLQKLVMRTVVESGEVLVRRRLRLPADELPIPMQLQVLDPDYIDTLKTGITLPNQGRIIHGIEFNVLGQRVAYWLFQEHPGSDSRFGNTFNSRRIPAESVLHIYKHSRPGQVRGVSWFAQVLLRFKDFDEFEDATLMKQKIAACLAVITSDVDGTAAPLGVVDETQQPAIDSLEPGGILNIAAGRSVTVVDPPAVREYDAYTKTQLRAIATGLGVTYEDLTGDYAGMPFSAARMSRLRHWARVDDWRWRTLIPQFCDPAWGWAMQAAQIMGLKDAPEADWTPPPAPFIDPAAEGLAITRNIRSGIQTLSDALRERGYDPATVLEEMAADNKLLDKLGIILDSDARNTTQSGGPRQYATSAPVGPDDPGGTVPAKPGDAPPPPPPAPAAKPAAPAAKPAVKPAA